MERRNTSAQWDTHTRQQQQQLQQFIHTKELGLSYILWPTARCVDPLCDPLYGCPILTHIFLSHFPFSIPESSECQMHFLQMGENFMNFCAKCNLKLLPLLLLRPFVACYSQTPCNLPATPPVLPPSRSAAYC